MSEYSAKMFEESDCIRVDQDYMNRVGDNDFCFIEDGPYSTDNVSEIFLCHWNRKYPGDRFLNLDLKKFVVQILQEVRMIRLQ